MIEPLNKLDNMNKKYPLKVNNIGIYQYCVMSKGHHSPSAFMQKVREIGYDWPLGNPEHVWVKITPCNTGEYQCYYNIVVKGTKGAFPATYSWEAYSEDTYEPMDSGKHRKSCANGK